MNYVKRVFFNTKKIKSCHCLAKEAYSQHSSLTKAAIKKTKQFIFNEHLKAIVLHHIIILNIPEHPRKYDKISSHMETPPSEIVDHVHNPALPLPIYP